MLDGCFFALEDVLSRECATEFVWEFEILSLLKVCLFELLLQKRLVEAEVQSFQMRCWLLYLDMCLEIATITANTADTYHDR